MWVVGFLVVSLPMCLSSIAFSVGERTAMCLPVVTFTGSYKARGERMAMCLPGYLPRGAIQGSWRTDGHVSPRCYLPREATRPVENGRPCVSPLLASTGRYTARGERTAMCLPVVTFTGSYKARGERMALCLPG